MDLMRVPPTRRKLLLSAAALAAPAVPVWAAQPWSPTKPIRLINPFPPGGTSDILARLSASLIGEELTQPIVVDNKPGATGSIGSQITSNAAPDGTTLVVAVTDSHCIYPNAFPKPIFSARDQVPVAPLAIIPFCLMTRPDFPASDLQEFVKVARTRQISYASWGNGSVGHVAGLILQKTAGIPDMLHVPYLGLAPAVQALIAGQVDMLVGAVAMAATYQGKVKTLAVMTPERVPSMPELRTFAEQGVPLRKEGEFWIGVFAPPRTPDETVKTLNRSFTAAVGRNEYKSRLAQLGMLPQSASPTEYAKFFRDDYERWGRFIREEGITIG